VRRIERDTLVAYVDRPWKMSLALFIGGSVYLALCAVFLPPWGSRDSDPGPIAMGLMPLAAAIILQYQGRAFFIDAARASLIILERRFLRPALRREFSLAGLEVRTSMAESIRFTGRRARLYWVWIDPPGRGSILFAHLHDQRTMQDLVSMLRADLRSSGTIPPPLADLE
jgi:hypothetical protein